MATPDHRNIFDRCATNCKKLFGFGDSESLNKFAETSAAAAVPARVNSYQPTRPTHRFGEKPLYSAQNNWNPNQKILQQKPSEMAFSKSPKYTQRNFHDCTDSTVFSSDEDEAEESWGTNNVRKKGPTKMAQIEQLDGPTGKRRSNAFLSQNIPSLNGCQNGGSIFGPRTNLFDRNGIIQTAKMPQSEVRKDRLENYYVSVSEDEEEPHGIVKDAPNIPQNAMNIVPLNNVSPSITKHHVKENWTVNNFSDCEEECLEFQVNLPNSDLAWSIWLYPKGQDQKNKDYVFLCLKKIVNDDNVGDKIIACSSRFCLQNSEEETIPLQTHQNPVYSDHVEYVKRDVLLPELLFGDSLTVIVEIDVEVEKKVKVANPIVPIDVLDRAINKQHLNVPTSNPTNEAMAANDGQRTKAIEEQLPDKIFLEFIAGKGHHHRRSVALIDVALEELMGGMVLKENAKNNGSIHENMEKTSPITNASYLANSSYVNSVFNRSTTNVFTRSFLSQFDQNEEQEEKENGQEVNEAEQTFNGHVDFNLENVPYSPPPTRQSGIGIWQRNEANHVEKNDHHNHNEVMVEQKQRTDQKDERRIANLLGIRLNADIRQKNHEVCQLLDPRFKDRMALIPDQFSNTPTNSERNEKKGHNARDENIFAQNESEENKEAEPDEQQRRIVIPSTPKTPTNRLLKGALDCDLCPMVCKSPAGLKNHRNRKHGQEIERLGQEQVFRCDVPNCKYATTVFNTPATLQKHKLNNHTARLICQFCRASFVNNKKTGQTFG